MAIDVSKRTAQIRTAIYGKDVRENISGGIEDIAGDVNQFEENSTNQWNNYKEVMDQDELTRKNNEDARISNENTRIANEGSRQTVYNDFRDMLNTSEKIGRLPYLFDGGAFGDSGDTSNWVLSMDGGSF